MVAQQTEFLLPTALKFKCLDWDSAAFRFVFDDQINITCPVFEGNIRYTSSQVLWRGEGQVCTVTLAIPTILHEAKAGQSGITILITPKSIVNFFFFNLISQRSKTIHKRNYSYLIKQNPVGIEVMIQCTPFAAAILQSLCQIQSHSQSHGPFHGLGLP